jgi:hypothetical protein
MVPAYFFPNFSSATKVPASCGIDALLSYFLSFSVFDSISELA